MVKEKLPEMSFKEQGGFIEEKAWEGGGGRWEAGPIEGTTQEICANQVPGRAGVELVAPVAYYQE